MKLSRPRFTLLTKFGIMGALPVMVLGVVLGQTLEGMVRARALVAAREQAALVSALRVRPHVTDDDLSHGLSSRRLDTLDRALDGSQVDKYVDGVTIFRSDGTIVYAKDRSGIGERTSSRHIEAALNGRVVSEITDIRAGGEGRVFNQVLAVYVPLGTASALSPDGVVRLELPYEPIALAIRADRQRLYVILLLGLSILYAALFHIVAKASKRLHRQAEENRYLALHDGLTNLPNRALFLERASQALLAAKRESYSVGVMILDLDRFKEINDTLGHHHGDLVLKQIGSRIAPLLRESDTIARLGGDEFAILLPRVHDEEAVTRVAKKIIATLDRPFFLEGLALDVDVSIGIACFPLHGKDTHTLVQRADVAMYQAKESGTGCEVYAAERDTNSPARLGLAGELRYAMARNELVLHYQPQVHFAGGGIRGVEALVRWNNPSRGLVYPNDFIPMAERGGLIQPLTLHILNGALWQCNEWDRRGLELNVSVNLSVRNLLDPQMASHVARLLKKWSVKPSRLELEITENSIMADPVRAMETLHELNELGVRIAVDDFGAGYSSLSSLKRLPITAVKIDKTFIENMADDQSDLVIVQSIIELAHNLGVEVVAEGVESEQTSKMLALLGCDFSQGYHSGRPVPSDDVPWMVNAAGSKSPETTIESLLPATDKAV